MSSMPLFAAWDLLLAASDVCKVLEGGKPYIYTMLGDALHSWLLTVAPPYAAAVTLYEQASSVLNEASEATGGAVPAAPFNLRTLRTSIVSTMARAVGLDLVIDWVLTAWRQIPEGARLITCNGLGIATEVVQFLDNAKKVALSAGEALAKTAYDIITDKLSFPNSREEFISKFLTPSPDDVMALIDVAGGIGNDVRELLQSTVSGAVSTAISVVTLGVIDDELDPAIDAIVTVGSYAALPATVAIDAVDTAVDAVADFFGF